MTTWWSEEKITWTVDQEYIERQLGSKKQLERLHRPLSFGDGLTDDTYLGWILERGRRLFLILNYIGTPESVFETIDKSFDDDDLPLSEAALWDLNLFGGKSETLDKKFYRAQFKFLVRGLVPGGHVDYDADEVVPVDPIAKRTTVSSNHDIDRVSVKERVYTRKKILISGDTGVDRVHFVMHLKSLQTIKHPHIVSVWAAYTQSDFSYILLTPSMEITLKTFFEEQPKSFKNLEKRERRETLLRWTHCLTSALAYLHEQGFTHQSIRPSNVSIDNKSNVYLSDFAALKALDSDDNPNPYSCELYDHAAPENWLRKPYLHETAPAKTIAPGGGRTSRKVPTIPVAPQPYISRSPNLANWRTRGSITTSSSSSSNSRTQHALITTFNPPLRATPPSCPADVFSITAILLNLLSLLLSHTPKSFATHRGRHNRHAGRGGAPADASFHANLAQVGIWIDMLVKDAKNKEKKERKSGKEDVIWGSVSEIAEVCRQGMRKEAKDRISARELEQEIRNWIDKALGTEARKCCGEEAEPSNSWTSRAEIYDSYACSNTASKDSDFFEIGDQDYERGILHSRQSGAYFPIQRKPPTSGTVSPEANWCSGVASPEASRQRRRHVVGRILKSGTSSPEDNWPLPGPERRRGDGEIRPMVAQTAGLSLRHRGLNLVM